jgi:hypothetical protein
MAHKHEGLSLGSVEELDFALLVLLLERARTHENDPVALEDEGAAPDHEPGEGGVRLEGFGQH